MSLRYPVNIQRRAAGAYVAGRWVPGALGPVERIMATVQPAQLADYDVLQPLLEGRRVEGVVRVYTAAQIAIAGRDAGVSGDELIWPNGMRQQNYVFMASSPWQSGIIPHFRYLAALAPVPR